MIQDQLTDYIASQMKLGVSREAIKTALVDAGWVAGDVEDTLKKNEGGTTMAQPAVSFASNPSPTSPATSVAASAKPANAGVQPQMIRVSDLVSSSAVMAPVTSPASSMSSGGSGSPAVAKPAAGMGASGAAMKSDPKMVDMSKLGGTISGNSFKATPVQGGGGKGGMVWGVIGGILIIILAGSTFYFYSQEAGLSAKVTTLTAQAASVSAQLASLNAQVGASSTVQAQITSLTAANADLALELSFFGATPGTTPTSTPVTISGQLSGGPRIPYAITTPRGAKIYILNYSDAKVMASMTPLIGQAVQITGSYVPGSDEVTVTTLTALNQ